MVYFQRFWQGFALQRFRFWLLMGLFFSLLLGFRFWFAAPALPQPTTQLTLLMLASEFPTWKELVQAFEQRHPEIRINLVEGPSSPDLLEDLYTSAFLLGRSPYDLVYMDIPWAPKFAAAGWLLDLSDRLSATEATEFMPGDLNGGRYQNGLYRVPLRSDAGLLYYRKDLLEQAGFSPPETTEQLLQISRTLQTQAKVRWGYLWQGRQYEGVSAMFVEVLQGAGGFWIDPTTRVVGLDQPAAIAAVKFLRSTIESGISPPGVTTYREEDTRHIFESGEAVFLRSWPYVWALSNSPDSPIQGKIGLSPMVHQAGQTSGACQGGWGLGISKTTAHPEAAWMAVQFFTSESIQRQMSLKNGYLPTRRKLFTDPELVAKYPHFPALLPVVERSVLRPPTPQYAQASDILQRYLSAAFTGQMSPEAAMKAAAYETRQLLSSPVEGSRSGQLAGSLALR